MALAGAICFTLGTWFGVEWAGQRYQHDIDGLTRQIHLMDRKAAARD